MIRIHNRAFRESPTRYVELSEVVIHTQNIDYRGRPYILFEHKDFPLGALRAEFDGTYWDCDLD